jgi:hypothetical protein
VVANDTCALIESAFDISFTQFQAWNPSLDAACLLLQLGDAYCVDGNNVAVSSSTFTVTSASSTTSISPSSSSTVQSTSTSATSVTAPGPTQTGIVANCNAWTLCESGKSPPAIRVSRKDRSLIRFLGCSCSAIESEYGLTFAQFYAWNPAIGSGCTDLELGEAYCVGV